MRFFNFPCIVQSTRWKYYKLEGGRGLAENDGIRGIIMGGSMINRATFKVVVVLGSRRWRFYVLHINLLKN